MTSNLIFITAYEPSGDRLGAAIIHALKAKQPDLQFVGVAGPLMRAAGCEAFLLQEDLAVMGIVEVLKQLPYLLKARKQVFEKALALKPLAYIGIDAPDSNLYIETKLKANGIKTVHVNSPTVWAWRSRRIKKIKKAVDLMLTLFPFETAIYEENQIPVKYIGHPLADELPLESQKYAMREKLKIASNTKILALMPGSRSSELKYIAPIFLKTANALVKIMPDLQIKAPMINEKRAAQFKALLATYPDLPIEVSIANAHEVLTICDAVLIASGTATLEAMLCKTPMVIAYKADALSAAIVRRLIKIPYVGLPNILAGKFIVEEYLQQDATVENLTKACLSLLNQQKPLTEELLQLHQLLKQDAAKQAAAAILDIIGHSGVK